MERVKLWTIGHSVRPADAFVEMLRRAGIELLVDVRAFPGSRRHPQFNREALQQRLDAEAIDYLWAGRELGGRRKPRRDSSNTALRNTSFRAYADHMTSPEFVAAASRLVETARAKRLAIMCAEHHPSRCHRRLIADWLTAHDVEVVHLIDLERVEPHRMTPGAVAGGDGVSYPGGPQLGLPLGAET
jgi:uncharacterized protein (DUF488 family)